MKNFIIHSLFKKFFILHFIRYLCTRYGTRITDTDTHATTVVAPIGVQHRERSLSPTDRDNGTATEGEAW
jgi:hypothetical protein